MGFFENRSYSLQKDDYSIKTDKAELEKSAYEKLKARWSSLRRYLLVGSITASELLYLAFSRYGPPDIREAFLYPWCQPITKHVLVKLVEASPVLLFFIGDLLTLND